jgi:hypothetical protein
MASCEPMYFTGVTNSQYEKMKSKLASMGYPLEGNSGTIKGPMGIVIEYAYDPAGSSLTVTVVEKSFFIPCGRIQSELSKAIRDIA